MPNSVREILACWGGGFKRYHSGNVKNAVPLCLMWCIWRERNTRTYDGIEVSLLKLKSMLKTSLFDWMRATRGAPLLPPFCLFRYL